MNETDITRRLEAELFFQEIESRHAHLRTWYLQEARNICLHIAALEDLNQVGRDPEKLSALEIELRELVDTYDRLYQEITDEATAYWKTVEHLYPKIGIQI